MILKLQCVDSEMTYRTTQALKRSLDEMGKRHKLRAVLCVNQGGNVVLISIGGPVEVARVFSMAIRSLRQEAKTKPYDLVRPNQQDHAHVEEMYRAANHYLPSANCELN